MTSDPGDSERSNGASGGRRGPDPTLDDLFGHLSHRRRRLLLYELLDADEPIGRRALARRIAAREGECAPADVSEEELTRIVVSLDHAHFPRLVDTDVIGYDRENGRVVATPGLDRMRPYLELARSEDREGEGTE